MYEYGYLGTVIAAILGYLIGSISWSVLISKFIFHKDVRNLYSKNAGATNTSRVLGVRGGLIVMALDMLKVPVSMLIAGVISIIGNHSSGTTTSYYIPALLTIIGHCFPVFFRFKGGKGVSCFIGLTGMINPFLFLIGTIIGGSLFFGKKTISLSSIISAVFVMALCGIPYLSFTNDFLSGVDSTVVWFNHAHSINSPSYYENLLTINIVVDLSALVLIAMHYSNINRLWKKAEPKFSFKKTRT